MVMGTALGPMVFGIFLDAEEVVTCLDQGKSESSLIPLQESRDIMALMDSFRYSWNLRYEGEKG